MNRLPGDEPAFLEFLLGGLATEDRERLEEQAFTDDAIHEQLEASADDLIHAYLAGALSAADERRFEVYFLASPRRRERLEFLRQLVTAVGRVAAVREPARRPAWRAFSPIAALALGGILAGLLWRLGGPGTQSSSAPPEAGPVEAVPSAPASPEPQRDPRPVHSWVGLVRPTQDQQAPTTVDLRGRPEALRFVVTVEEGALSFDATIRDADGTEVWAAVELPPPVAGEALVVTVPARAFSGAGERYTLQVQPEALRNAGPGPPRVEYALRVRR